MSTLQIPDVQLHARTAAEAITAFASDAGNGLDAREVQKRQALYGKNQLQAGEKVSGMERFLAQFKDPQIYLLLAAAIVSFIVSILEHTHGIPNEALIILAIVFLNAIVGFLQEDRSARALASLKAMVPAKATVIRDGTRQSVLAEDLVPGDLLLVQEGDRVSADARLIQVTAFRTMEAPLTGESFPAVKNINPVEGAAGVADRVNMIFAGTNVISGHAEAIVTATGMRTEFGKIAELVRASESPTTPLQQELRHLSKQLSVAVVGIAALAIAALLFIHGVHSTTTIVEVLLFGIALAVAATPEGLAAVITLVLAIGMRRMALRGAIARRMPVVEALGSATVIASDKTGTLTRNEMNVRAIVTRTGHTAISGNGYAPQGLLTGVKGEELSEDQWTEVRSLLRAASLANNAHLSPSGGGWSIQGDPTEAALLTGARKAGIIRSELENEYPRVAEVALSSERKMMSTVHRKGQCAEEYVVFSKGAPDVLIDHCSHEFVAGQTRPLTAPRRRDILVENERLAEGGLRTLGIASRELPAAEAILDHIGECAVEHDLTFLGLVGMMDPPRPEARVAVERARSAGVRTILITGDHPRTALRVAHDLNLTSGNHVLTGAKLDEMSDDELIQAVRETAVYARVNPEHKLRIVRALQQNHEVVAMTGDGVNDAPALKAAQIGIAMGITGTDVAKEAADLILTDDNFATIVAAIEEGRIIFDNIQKFLRYLLATNAGEVLTIFLASAILSWTATGSVHSLLLPLSAAQILCINLITDGAPALALGVDTPQSDIMRRPPRRVNERIIDHRMVINILITAITMTIGTLWVFLRGSPNAPDQTSQTMAFTTLIFFQLFNSLNARSATSSTFDGAFRNLWLWGAILFSLMVQIALVTIPFLRDAFDIVPLARMEWLYCGIIASGILWVSEAEKYVTRRAMRSAAAKI